MQKYKKSEKYVVKNEKFFNNFSPLSSHFPFPISHSLNRDIEKHPLGKVQVRPMDGAVGPRVLVVEVERPREFVALVEPAPRVVKDDGVGVVGAIHGVGNADAVGTAEVDNESGILGGAERGVAFAHIHDGPTESYLVMLDAAGQ